MTKIFLSALVLTLCAAASRAQTIEDADSTARAMGRQAAATMAKTHQDAVKAAQDKLYAPVVFPKTIVCDGGKILEGTYKFYPRLQAIKSLGDLDATKPTNLANGFVPEKDETAAALDDGHAISATRSELHYDMVSCDTQDYFFTFQMSELAKPLSPETTRKITGHVRMETRGTVDAEGDIACTANY